MMLVQVKNQMYGYKCWRNNKKSSVILNHYLDLKLGRFQITRKADPLTPQTAPALVNFLDRYIILTGGHDE